MIAAMRLIIKFSVVAAAFVVLFATSSISAERNRTLSLTATGSVSARPDMAQITTGVQTEAKTAREALTANNIKMDKVLKALKAAGLEEKDIQTSNFSVNPRYRRRKSSSQDDSGPSIISYWVSNDLTIVVRDLDKLGDILDQVVTLGSNRINGISFSVSEPGDALDQARKLAMQNAISRAKLYAEAAGAKLGKVLTINEQTFSRPPRPMMMRAAKMESAPSAPIAAGEQELSVRVSVSWELE